MSLLFLDVSSQSPFSFPFKPSGYRSDNRFGRGPDSTSRLTQPRVQAGWCTTCAASAESCMNVGQSSRAPPGPP